MARLYSPQFIYHLSMAQTAFITAYIKLYNNGKEYQLKDDCVKTYILHSLSWGNLTKIPSFSLYNSFMAAVAVLPFSSAQFFYTTKLVTR